jgi:hypothetical protein
LQPTAAENSSAATTHLHHLPTSVSRNLLLLLLMSLREGKIVELRSMTLG